MLLLQHTLGDSARAAATAQQLDASLQGVQLAGVGDATAALAAAHWQAAAGQRSEAQEFYQRSAEAARAEEAGGLGSQGCVHLRW